MTETIPADRPITGELSPEQIADLVEQAAQLIETDGLEVGDLWTDALVQPYEPGMSCCTGGALAAVCGYRDAVDVEEDFTAAAATYDVAPHPVFAAVMAELGFTEPEHLYDWSDTAGDREVVKALRETAAKIRTGGAA